MPKLLIGLALTGTLAGGVVADQAVNPYDTVAQTLQTTDDSTLVEGGENKVILDETKPKMTLSKWNGEVQMGVTYDGLEATGQRPFLSKNVEWRGTKQTMEVVPLEKTATMEDGGYEINILLSEQPVSNVFTFSIDGWENLDFFYQPALTDKEIQEGAFRPENVVGSYAVYYKDHANHKVGSTNYATGKAYHIFRPLVSDADGATVWADLSYSNGVLSVTVPQSFLDIAVYPVKVDPTFGYTTIGGTSGTAGKTYLGNKYTTTQAGTITSFSAYRKCDSSGTNCRRTTSFWPGGAGSISVLDYGAENSTANASPQWDVDTSQLSYTFLASTAYRVETNSDNNAHVFIYFDTTITRSFAVPANYVNPPESPTTFTDSGTVTYSIYATYTASSGAVVSGPSTVTIKNPIIIKGATLIK